MPLQRRLPKFGFSSRTAPFNAEVRLDALNRISAEVVDAAELKSAGVVDRRAARIKVIASGKPENLVDRIVTGKMEKFYSELVLLEQPFVKNPDQSVGEMIAEKVAKIGENIQVRRFARFKLGEGIEKKADNFAEEVAQQVADAG
jgi:elongation factor Ts